MWLYKICVLDLYNLNYGDSSMKKILTLSLQFTYSVREYFQIKFLMHGTAVILCLFITVLTAFAQRDRPQYVNAEAGWQWPAYSDGVTYIPVCWENPEGYSTERQWVRSAIASTWKAPQIYLFRDGGYAVQTKEEFGY
jgi:hypothetical protein